jgi:hypothetical protein
MLLAFGITTLLIVTVGPIDYISTKHPNNPLDTIASVVLVLVVVALVFGAHKALWGKLQIQRKIMSQFALQNGWQFEGNKNKEADDPALLPTDWRFPNNTAEQLYCIQGNVYGESFSLYSLLGFDRTMRTRYGRRTLGYRTVLRTTAPLNSLGVPDSIQVVHADGWNYAVINGNAMTASEIQAIFQPLAKP